MQIAPSVYFYPFLSSGENNCNTIVLDGPEKVIIDPGHKHLWPELRKKIQDDGLSPSDFSLALYTHCHPDHMEAGQNLEADYGTVQAMSRQEKIFFDGPGLEFFTWMGLDFPNGSISRILDEGPLDLGDKVINMYLTPGHTPGELCFHWPEKGLLITGDLIFANSFGRIDFPGGNLKELIDSIKRMEKLEGVDIILPGHGPAVLGAANVAKNYKNILSLIS